MYAINVGNYVSGCFQLTRLTDEALLIRAPTSNACIVFFNII